MREHPVRTLPDYRLSAPDTRLPGDVCHLIGSAASCVARSDPPRLLRVSDDVVFYLKKETNGNRLSCRDPRGYREHLLGKFNSQRRLFPHPVATIKTKRASAWSRWSLHSHTTCSTGRGLNTHMTDDEDIITVKTGMILLQG